MRCWLAELHERDGVGLPASADQFSAAPERKPAVLANPEGVSQLHSHPSSSASFHSRLVVVKDEVRLVSRGINVIAPVDTTFSRSLEAAR